MGQADVAPILKSVTLRKLPSDEMDERLRWLLPLSGRRTGTGLDPSGPWQTAVWLLGTLYERDDVPVMNRIEAHAAGRDVYDVVPPAPPWRRIRWSELANRPNFDIACVSGRYPNLSYVWQQHWPDPGQCPADGRPDIVHHHGSWPIAFSLGESLGEPLLSAVIEVLLGYTHTDTDCAMYYDAVPGEALYTGSLTDLPDLISHVGEIRHAPTNIWPPDRSWFLYCDFDLYATKISGPPALIAALAADATLETLRVGSSR